MKRIWEPAFLFLLTFPALLFSGETITISILSLLEPRDLQITLLNEHAILVGENHEEQRALKPNEEMQVTLFQQHLRLKPMERLGESFEIICPARCRFKITVPGEMERIYHGNLLLKGNQDSIDLLLEMDEEELLAGILASETGSIKEIEFLKAFAIISRTFLKAGRRHPSIGADFCDTTHCQVFRALNPSPSILQAIKMTQALILTYRQQPFFPFYSRECGGNTATYQQVWNQASPDYPYYEVDCTYCKQSASAWSTQLSIEQLQQITGISTPQFLSKERMIRSKDGKAAMTYEAFRILSGRLLGWNSIKSNLFDVQRDTDHVIFSGKGKGHRAGLCQLGAASMAKNEMDYPTILTHYFPNTEIKTLQKLHGVAF